MALRPYRFLLLDMGRLFLPHFTSVPFGWISYYYAHLDLGALLDIVSLYAIGSFQCSRISCIYTHLDSVFLLHSAATADPCP